MLAGCAGATALLLGAAVLAARPAAAGIDVWTAGDQPGGTVFKATLAGETCYAAPIHGLFRSTDGCRTWARVPELTGKVVEDIAVDADLETAYVATREGMWRTRDGGGTWAEIAGEGIEPGGLFSGVAADPARAGLVWFAALNELWRSTTAGDGFWEPFDEGLPQRAVDLVVNPNNDVAWAWTASNGVWVLNFGTLPWAFGNTGLGSLVQELAIDRSAGRILARSGYEPYTLPQSGGPTWTLLGTGLASSITTLTADREGTAYAIDFGKRLYRLPSGAGTWSPTDAGLPSGSTLNAWADGVVPGRVLVRTAPASLLPLAQQPRLWLSENGGTTWTPSEAGIAAVDVGDMAVDTTRPGVVLAATHGDAVQRSEDTGRTWTGSSGIGLQVYSIAFDPTRGDLALATANEGLLRSPDGGRTWIGPVAGVGTFPGGLVVGTGGTAYMYDGGMVVSQDGGATWSPLPTAGLPASVSLSQIVPDAVDDRTVWAVGIDGIFRLGSGETEWMPRAPQVTLLSPHRMTIDANQPGTIYVATLAGGIWRSQDAGEQWAQASHGIPDLVVADVATDLRVAGTAYAATSSGVYRTTDRGETWTALAPPPSEIFDLAADADGFTLYGATAEMGVLTLTQCPTFADCEPRLLAALPRPDGLTGAARRLARKLGKLEASAARSFAKASASEGRRRAKLYRRCTRALDKIVSRATAGDESAILGVALAPIRDAVTLLRRFVPAS